MATKTTTKRKGSAAKKRETLSPQATAVILFAVAIFLICVMCVPTWRFLMFGMFGICALLVPPFLIYVSVLLAKEVDKALFNKQTSYCVLFLVLLGSTIHTLAAKADRPYGQALKLAFQRGREFRGAGVFGALLGHPLEAALKGAMASIVLLLVLFVFVMLVTKTSVLVLFKIPAKLFAVLREQAEKRRAAAEEEDDDAVVVVPEKKEKKGKKAFDHEKEETQEKVAAVSPIDVDLGEGYVSEEAPAPMEAQVKETKKARSRKEIPLAELAEESTETGVDDSIGAELAEAADLSSAVPAYRYPPISLLHEVKTQNVAAAQQEQQQTADLLIKTLNDFGVSARVIAVSRGPSVTRYELEPSAGVKLSKITGLADDIALRLATTGVRIEAPIPNKAAVGIEVPNRARMSIGLREMIDAPDFSSAKSKLTVALGRDIAGNIVYTDLAKMPHLLIAGTTGSGKSVCTNMMIQSVLFRASPDEVRLLLIDPKMVEFGAYNGIPHLLVPVVTDPRKAAGALGWAVTEMLARYKAFAENNVRNLEEYNRLAQKSDTLKTKPQILILIDELADLMMAAKNEVEDSIVRLAQMARAAGMHLVIATQRPSVDVITGLIKANIPSRLSLTVASATDSRTILDCGGAEKLLGRGDMLFMPLGMSKPMRIQGGYVDMEEIEAVVDFLKGETSEEIYDDEIIQEIERQASAAANKGASGAADDDEDESSDEMLPQAVEVVIEAGMASTSLLQRKLRLGYARAGRLVDEMERRGIVGPHEGSKPRQVLITRQQWLEKNALRDD